MTHSQDDQDEHIARTVARQGGGHFSTSSGLQGYVPGKNQHELLHDVCDLLREIRDLLKVKPQP